MSMTRIDLSVVDGIAWITLDGPASRNALDGQAVADLVAACDRIDADTSVGAAVVTGTDPAFCSGADTRILERLRTARADDAYQGLEELYRGFRRFAALTVPTVAAVNGAAVGAGLNLALAADLRVMANTAVLVSGFAAIGLHPGGGHLHLLARASGSVAAAMGVFAQPMRAGQAVSTGVAWAAVEPSDLRSTVASMVRHLAADPALARALAADLRQTVYDTSGWERAIDIERARQLWSLARPKGER